MQSSEEKPDTVGHVYLLSWLRYAVLKYLLSVYIFLYIELVWMFMVCFSCAKQLQSRMEFVLRRRRSDPGGKVASDALEVKDVDT